MCKQTNVGRGTTCIAISAYNTRLPCNWKKVFSPNSQQNHGWQAIFLSFWTSILLLYQWYQSDVWLLTAVRIKIIWMFVTKNRMNKFWPLENAPSRSMKKGNMFSWSKRQKVSNKVWKRQRCFLPASVRQRGTGMKKANMFSSSKHNEVRKKRLKLLAAVKSVYSWLVTFSQFTA